MRRILIFLIVCLLCTLHVSALESEPPEVPDSGELYMPDNTESFGEGLWYIVRTAIYTFLPEIRKTASICISIIASLMIVSILDNYASTKLTHLASTVLIGTILLNPAGIMIQLGLETVTELAAYGKMLVPVLTGAMAAQGGITTSSSLYVITVFGVTFLTTLITKLIIPLLYLYFCLTVITSVFAEQLIISFKQFIKWLITWSLKIILYVFTGFIGITGVVSGTADASAVKATKIAISGMVPVVGGIISDASETILISAATVKNAAGIYGILAIISIVIGPFIKIGTQYLMLKFTGAVCSVFSGKQESELLKDFSGGMGMLLGMTGTICLMLLVSTVCFMKGVS